MIKYFFTQTQAEQFASKFVVPGFVCRTSPKANRRGMFTAWVERT